MAYLPTTFLEISGTGAVINATPIAATDTRQYNSAVLQVSGTFTGTFVIEGSCDNSIWNSVSFFDLSATSKSTAITSSSSAGIFSVSFVAAYLRVRLSTYVSGTVVAKIILKP